MIEYGKYHILDGIYPHNGLHICLLADGNIHNIKLIYRCISNNDLPVKTLLTFCGVYNRNRPDIKGNPYNFKHLIVGVSYHLHILMKRCGFKSRISLKSGCLCKRIHLYISSIDMILKVTSNFKIP